jgi:hypothetical protein
MLTRFLVTRDELPKHVDHLMTVMREGFGEEPAALVSKEIARRFYSELNLEIPSDEHLSVQECIKVAGSQRIK